MVLNELIAYSRLGALQGDARPAHLHDRHLRPLRLRQLQLDRHPDRRHRRARPRAAGRPRPARPARAARGHLRQLHDRLHRRGAAVSQLPRSGSTRPPRWSRSRTPLAPRGGRRPRLRPRRLRRQPRGRGRDPLRARSRTSPPRRSSATAASSCSAAAGGVPVAVMKGRVHYYEGYTPRAGGLPGPRARAPRGRDAGGDERRGQRQRGLRAGRADGDRGPHQPASATRSSARTRTRSGARFLDMSEAYDRGLRDVAEAACRAARRAARTAASTSRSPGRPTRRRPRSAWPARWAPTPSACPPCPR